MIELQVERLYYISSFVDKNVLVNGIVIFDCGKNLFAYFETKTELNENSFHSENVYTSPFVDKPIESYRLLM